MTIDLLRFPADGEQDAGKRGPHPFSGIPMDLYNRLGDLGTNGINYYFNHFHQWEGPVAEGSAAGWVLSGTTGAATIALVNNREGAIVLTADATASCNPTLQLGSATLGAGFGYVVGKRMWCFARLKVAGVATTELFFGLATPDTSPTTTGTFPSDGIFFEKALTATSLNFHARQDGTSTTKTSATTTALADDTYTTIGFMVDKSGSLFPYQNGSFMYLSGINKTDTNIPDATADVLQLTLGILGASKTCTIDWVLAAQEI